VIDDDPASTRAGVTIRVAPREAVPRELQTRFAIFDESIVHSVVYGATGEAAEYVYSADAADVMQALDRFDRLRTHAEEIVAEPAPEPPLGGEIAAHARARMWWHPPGRGDDEWAGCVGWTRCARAERCRFAGAHGSAVDQGQVPGLDGASVIWSHPVSSPPATRCRASTTCR
jgi:uncharacterized protein DUF6879